MAERNDYSNIITEREFTETDKFRRARKARVICDASGKVLGSVSVSGLFDLFGECIAFSESEKTEVGKDGSELRVIEYSSQMARYRLVGDELYSSDDGRYIGRIVRNTRNVFRIAVLGALAVMLATAIILIALISLPPGGTPEPEYDPPVIDISDGNGSWDSQGVIGVFGHSVKPGSKGKYEFVINNPHDFRLQYAFYIEPKYDGAEIDEFPIMFRLRMNNVPVQSEEWKTVEKLRFEELVLLPSSSHSFTLEWSWPFEAGKDENDTFIGADGGSISLVLHLTAQAR